MRLRGINLIFWWALSIGGSAYIFYKIINIIMENLHYLGLVPAIILMLIGCYRFYKDRDDMLGFVVVYTLATAITIMGAVWFIQEAQAVEMTATVEKSEYYVCLDSCELKCLTKL